MACITFIMYHPFTISFKHHSSSLSLSLSPSHLSLLDALDDIKSCLTEMEACFQILMPKFDFKNGSIPSSLEEPDISDNEEESDKGNESSSVDDSDSEIEWEDVGGGGSGDLLGAHGMLGHGWSLTLDIPKRVEVQEGEDNDSIVLALRERYKIVTSKYIPSLNKWIEV